MWMYIPTHLPGSSYLHTGLAEDTSYLPREIFCVWTHTCTARSTAREPLHIYAYAYISSTWDHVYTFPHRNTHSCSHTKAHRYISCSLLRAFCINMYTTLSSRVGEQSPGDWHDYWMAVVHGQRRSSLCHLGTAAHFPRHQGGLVHEDENSVQSTFPRHKPRSQKASRVYLLSLMKS